MSVEWWSVHHGVAGSAVLGGVAAAVTEAGGVTDKDLVRAERMPVRAAVWRLHHPLAVGRPDKVALHP